MAQQQQKRNLLPTNVVPIHYDLHFTPLLDEKKFTATVISTVHVVERTNAIKLHAKELTFAPSGVKYLISNISCTHVVFDEKDESVLITFEHPLPLGTGHVRIDYAGILNDQMAGFYSSSYTNAGGVKRNMASTQMEPTDCRRAIPCWDEPALKATFTVKITHPSDRIAISNMPVASTSTAGDLTTVTFAKTPKMSSYLLAFVVGEFESIETTTSEGVVVRVFTRIGSLEQGKFALDVAAKTLSYFTQYFGIAYPLPKSDMIAIPDFAAGAMENWGLITYRETALLIDPVNSSVAQKQRVAYVVAHELAHQWFGNLVSPQWWKELWLNEGFATWVGNLATDHLFPEWQIWTQFVTQYGSTALSLDAMVNSHPIEVEVSDSAQVNEIFDAISYNKGSCIIRMIAEYLGEAAFKTGLHNYLLKHQYANAVTADLWAALSHASEKDVARLMNDWTSQTGYPVVSVDIRDDAHLSVSQTRFLSNGAAAEGRWVIGLNIQQKGGKAAGFMMEYDTTAVPVAVSSSDASDWVKVNAAQSGFYRVRYSATLQARLEGPIKALTLSPVDRLGVQNDAFALAQAGLLPMDQPLALARYYVNDDDYTVWSDLSTNLGAVARAWSDEPNYHQLQAYIREIFRPIAAKLGWEPVANESPLTALLRPLVLTYLCAMKDKQAIATAQEKFAKFVGNEEAIAPDLRFVVYRTAVQNGGEAEFNAVLSLYKTSQLAEEKIRALRALGFTPDPALLHKVLEMSIDATQVRSQDTVYVIGSTVAGAAGRNATWRFFKSEFARFQAAFGSGQFLFSSIIKSICSGFSTEAMAADVEEFFKANPVPPAARSIQQSLETIRNQARWLTSQRQVVADFLSKNASHNDEL